MSSKITESLLNGFFTMVIMFAFVLSLLGQTGNKYSWQRTATRKAEKLLSGF